MLIFKWLSGHLYSQDLKPETHKEKKQHPNLQPTGLGCHIMSTNLQKVGRRSKKRTLMFLAVILIVVLAATSWIQTVNHLKGEVHQRELKLQNTQTQIYQLDKTLDQVKSDKAKTEDQKNQQIQQLEKDKSDLQSQLQAKAEEKSRLAQVATTAFNDVTATRTVSAAAPAIVDGCGDNALSNYIYMHESSCNLTVVNAEGCIGIGQACPASKLTNACPNLDYACENAFFTDYANSRYGGWEGAYAYWLINHWW